MDAKKKIAVIGGGVSGLGTMVALAEVGCFEIVGFEKTDQAGGTWCYREESYEGVPSATPMTVLLNSKEMGAFSNFPPKKQFHLYMRYYEQYEYMMEWADRWNVRKYIQYNTDVILLKRSNDYEATGKWTVTSKNTKSGKSSTDVFDGVVVCSGHFNRPKTPAYQGQSKFKGKIMHTHTLRKVEPYQDKNVVVVGMGASGLDAAVTISNVAKQVYLSTRSGAHVVQRVGPNGYPSDYTVFRRCAAMLIDILPFTWCSRLFQTFITDTRFNPKLYNVPPDHHILAKNPVVNDQIAFKLLSGFVIQKRNIYSFSEDGVLFEGDSEVTKADVVVMATGYGWSFPFLEEGVLEKENGKFHLYKHIFPAQLPHSTLAFVGFILPFGPGFPVGELQERWTAQVLAGKCRLPSREDMEQDIGQKYELNLSRYVPHEKMALQVEFVQYCDEIASQFGAKPNLWKMLVTDPVLFVKLFFGPHLSYQYRLQGPHPWDGAREAIMTSGERMLYPLTKKNRKDPSDKNIILIFVKRIVALFIS